MPWSEEHKQKTRERILDAAATMFREHGIEQTSVADIMERAGLTHGGFYAHFESKADLVAEAVAHAFAQLGSLFATGTGGEVSGNPVLSLVGKYLSPTHLLHPERGCPVAALGAELTRSGPKTRKLVAQEIRKRFDRLYARTASGLSPDTRRRQAAGALACMLGGLILARSLNGREALEFLQNCQGFLTEALSLADAKSESHAS